MFFRSKRTTVYAAGVPCNLLKNVAVAANEDPAFKKGTCGKLIPLTNELATALVP